MDVAPQTPLPDLSTLNAEQLRALILTQQKRLAQEIEQRDQAIAERDVRIAQRDIEIEHLKLLIAKLKRLQFGRKSEKLGRHIEQLELRPEDLEAKQSRAAAETGPEATPETTDSPDQLQAAAARKPARRPLPKHLPLYRQSEIYERVGVELERSTLAGWVGAASETLAPLVEAVRRYVMSASKLHGDDTPVPVLAPGNGKTKTGRLWTYVRDDRPSADPAAPAVWFAYSPDRKGEHPEQHLRDFRGTLQADGYAGFNRVYETGRAEENGCWAHVRRKFFDLHQAHASPMAGEALTPIGALFDIESEIRGCSPDERLQVRQARARPLLDSLHEWLEAGLAKLSKKSDVAVAIRYALGRWAALLRYCNDGRLEIDNNAAERALRAVALGRKNYLFAGCDAGGERAAAMYTLIGSEMLNGLDPEAYLRFVLERIADHPISRITELLPWNVRLDDPVSVTHS